MDLATIIGLVLGAAAMVFSIISGSGMEGFKYFIDIPSLIIVVGGGIAAVLISYPLSQVLSIFSVAGKAFKTKGVPTEQLIAKFTELSTIARKEGLLALEPKLNEESDEFLQKSVRMAVDGMNAENIRATLENEIDCARIRHAQSQGIFETLAAQFPAWGMVGTLIGLVLLLQNLSDPSAIGPSMAVAIITTLYGSIFANYICNPIAKKLEIYSEEEAMTRTLIIEGVICLSQSMSPIMMEQKLNSFLSSSKKAKAENLEKNK